MTTAEASYEGWSNRETWNTCLWISNTESLYKLVKKLITWETATFADNLEQFLWIIWEGKTPDNCSLKPVNWVEIATFLQSEHTDYLDSLDSPP